MSEELTQEQVDQLVQEAIQDNAPSVSEEEIKMSEEEALLLRYEQLADVVIRMSTAMSARSLGRVMRAAIRHPFHTQPKFVNNVEKMVFDAFTKAEDLKMVYVNKVMAKMEAQQKDMGQGLEQAAQAASEVTESKSE